MPLIRPKKRWFQIGFKQIKKIVPKGAKIIQVNAKPPQLTALRNFD